jgi:hypothetical protein
MKKVFITAVFALFLCFNLVSCVSTPQRIPQRIIDINGNPDSEFMIDATWLKEPIMVKLTLDKWTNKKLEKSSTIQIINIYPKDKIRIRLNSKDLADKIFMGKIDCNGYGLHFSTGWMSSVWNPGRFKGISEIIILTSDGKSANFSNRTYKDVKQ